MRRAALVALLSHWRRQPLQLFTLIAGLALATALWSAVQAINGEARRSYARASETLDSRAFETLANPSAPLTVETFVTLRRAGWLVSPLIEGRIIRGDTRLRVTGVDVLTMPEGFLPAAITEADAAAGSGSGGLPLDAIGLISPDTLDGLADRTGLPELRANPAIPPGQMVTSLAVADRLLEAGGRVDRLILLPDQPLRQTPLEKVAPDLVRTPPPDPVDTARLTDSFHLNLTAFGLLSFAVGLFIVHGTVGLAMEQRRQIFRTLRALGLPGRELLALLLAELLLLALIAGTLGLLLGYAIAAMLLPDVAASLRGLYGANVTGTLRFDPGWIIAGLVIALAGALVAATHGLVTVHRMPLLVSAQPRAWAVASNRTLHRQAAAGSVLIGAGAMMPILFDGLISGFLLLGGLLIGAALVLPLVLSLVLKAAAAHAHSVTWQWFWADTRQQLPGLSLALMALMLALATNIGVSTMVSSFRLTFTGWLDQRLASDLYVTARDEADAEALRNWLAPRADAVLPIWPVEVTLGGAPGEVYGIVDHPVYRDHWPMLDAGPEAWDNVLSGRAALINEQLARREDLAPGDPVSLGVGWSMPVAGIYSDYGNPAGQAIVGIDALLAHHPKVPRLRHGVVTGDPTGLANAIRDEFGLPQANMIDQSSLKKFSLQVFDRTFTVTAALNVLTLSVAGFAILTALLTLSSMRLPQLAPVWALGLTRRQLVRLEILRSLALAALTSIVALPVGIALAWCLLVVVNAEAFGWRLPVFLFPMQWVKLITLALIAALVASALPARRLSRVAPATFLKVFADER